MPLTRDLARKSRTEFGAASGSVVPAPHGAMAFIVDVQDVGSMDRDDAARYLDKLGRSIDLLRQNEIQVTWIAMGRGNHLYRPETSAAVSAIVRDTDALIDMGYYGAAPGHKGSDLFRKFLEDHGPRTSEAVYSKFYKSALLDPADHAGRPALESMLRRDYSEEVRLPGPGEFKGHSLAQYARELGVTRPLILGAVSTHCVSETAVSAVLKDMRPTIGVDSVLSWEGREDKVNPRTTRLLWEAEGDFHRSKIQTRLGEVLADDRRGLSAANKDAIGKIGFSGVSDFIASLPASAPVSAPSAPRPGS